MIEYRLPVGHFQALAYLSKNRKLERIHDNYWRLEEQRHHRPRFLLPELDMRLNSWLRSYLCSSQLLEKWSLSMEL